MKTKLLLLAIVFAISASVILNGHSVAQQTEADSTAQIKKLKGLWVSDRGSTLEIDDIDEESGEISAWFRSSTGTDGKAFPVVGFLNLAERFPGAESFGHPISFAVSWGPFGSISSWNGLVRQEKTQTTIDTQWLYVRGSTQFDWDHTLTGNDLFKRPPPM